MCNFLWKRFMWYSLSFRPWWFDLCTMFFWFQVELALDVERVVPEFIRRRFVTKCDTYKPNKKTLNPLKLLARAEAGELSSQAISKALDPDLVSHSDPPPPPPHSNPTLPQIKEVLNLILRIIVYITFFRILYNHISVAVVILQVLWKFLIFHCLTLTFLGRDWEGHGNTGEATEGHQ